MSSRAARRLVAALLPLALASCSRNGLRTSLVPNQPPVVELTGAPADTSSKVSYVMRFSWAAFDPDGEVAYFLYAIDPPKSGDTTWIKTTGVGGTFTFSAARVDSVSIVRSFASEYHTFVIKAVDNQGLASPPDWRSFTARTIAPQVRILIPQPNYLIFPRVAPSVVIVWTGTDPDGTHGKKPVKYKFKLYGIRDPAIDLGNPSTFNRLGPSFSSWESVGGDTTSVIYDNLTPDERYAFVLTGIDEAGAWDPVFTLNTNVLILRVTFAHMAGPVITLYNQYFNYTYPSGGYYSDPSTFAKLEVPADAPIRMSWSATSTSGSYVRRYRWAVDIADLDDETPRSDQYTDLKHWSAWTTGTGVVFGPYSPEFTETHRFYLEAEDAAGLTSLGVAEINVVRATQDRDLLIVDDRRGQPDNYPSYGRVGPPAGSWPSEAELDTFYYAIGGVPWKGYGPENGLPYQLMSKPGIFNGYDFDTLDTRGSPDPTVPLSVLGRYGHVMWYTDKASAEMAGPSYDIFSPATSLRYMTSPNRFNSLSLYLVQNGKLFLFGGGIVSATARGWGDADNIFQVGGASPTLAPGRFPYDVLHMRAEMKQFQFTQVRASPKRPAMFAGLIDLRHRSQTDSLPPLRTAVPLNPWCEGVNKPLLIREDTNPDPFITDSTSVLDTLYVAVGGTASNQPAGFYYHGLENPPVIYLGFDLWTWGRASLIQTVDYFLQNVWGLPRRSVPR